MKTIIKTGLLLCAIVWSAFQTTAQTPVSWWQGEGNVLDSQDGNNGVVDVSRVLGYTNGVLGQAFDFQGAFVTVPDAPSLDPATVSVQAWVKSPSSQLFKYII